MLIISGNAHPLDDFGAWYASVELYDFDTTRWSRVANLSGPRWHHKAITLEEKVYVFGGIGTTRLCENVTEAYDGRSASRGWRNVTTSWKSARHQFAIAGADDRFYFLGGWCLTNEHISSQSAEMFRPDIGALQCFPPQKVEQKNFPFPPFCWKRTEKIFFFCAGRKVLSGSDQKRKFFD